MRVKDRERSRRMLREWRERRGMKVSAEIPAEGETGAPPSPRIDFTEIKGVGRGTQKKIEALFGDTVGAIVEYTAIGLAETLGFQYPTAGECAIMHISSLPLRLSFQYPTAGECAIIKK